MASSSIEKRREYMREYKAKNRERMRELNRESAARVRATPEGRSRQLAAEKRWRDANKEKVARKNAARRNKFPNESRRHALRYHYGLSENDYRQMLTEQDFKCDICGSEDTGSSKKAFLCVDHCHKTGKVRALLCDPCNNGLGRFKDDPMRVAKALKYICRHEGVDLKSLVDED